MSMRPVSIKLFLCDGDPDGIRTAELSNWTGKALAGPRSDLSNLLLRDELRKPGVYFLSSKDTVSGLLNLYIGEAESVGKRIRQHQSEDNWDWIQLISFVSKDENLTKAHIRYLEGALISKAKASSRICDLNNQGGGARLPESDQAEMDVFLENMLKLLPVLGITELEPESEKPADMNQMLFGVTKGCNAQGNRTAGGFVVYEGSQAVKEHRASAGKTKKRRESLIEQGVLVEDGDAYCFSRNYEFGSPSEAGAMVCGGATNGLTFWRNKDQISLKEIEAKLVE
ncbi:GIY-YIG nuclease family protein [Neptuniibacter sp. QD48_55]|uniref:GIY-YIG nuclease family protein n=1 Tax=Neptuniibacter sp. QD48_55 TaxID=3398212 RepID=UPI0039F4971B